MFTFDNVVDDLFDIADEFIKEFVDLEDFVVINDQKESALLDLQNAVGWATDYLKLICCDNE